MTALERYDWLEAVGQWREGPDAPLREVIVSFRDATLVLSDLAERPLGHWALAGMQALRVEGGATVYSTTPEGYETLAIRDAQMNEAIAAVTRAPARNPAPPRRSFRLPAMVAALASLAAALNWGPGLIRDQALRMVSPEQAAEFGDRMLIEAMETTGPLCAAPAGVRALDRMAAVLAAPGETLTLHVTDLSTGPAARLPGRRVLLDRQAVEASEGPSDLAALVPQPPPGGGPTADLIAETGVLGGLRFIFTGRIDDATLARATAAALAPPPTTAPPAEAAPNETPLLDPADWAALRAICAEDPAPGAGGSDRRP